MIPKTRRVTPGWEWSVSIGYDTHKGNPQAGTDDKIIKGWAPTREQAKEAAEKKMRELKAEEQLDESDTSESLFQT